MEKAEMKIAPSTPTLSIAATISSPVTWSGQFGTLRQGRSVRLVGMHLGIDDRHRGKLLCARVWLSQQGRVQRAKASCVADAGQQEHQFPTAAIVEAGWILQVLLFS